MASFQRQAEETSEAADSLFRFLCFCSLGFLARSFAPANARIPTVETLSFPVPFRFVSGFHAIEPV
jgi:hypothetical protein